MTVHDFCFQVGQVVESEYGLTDGDDLCYNLVEGGVIDMQQGVRQAAAIVAQHLEQQ